MDEKRLAITEEQLEASLREVTDQEEKARYDRLLDSLEDWIADNSVKKDEEVTVFVNKIARLIADTIDPEACLMSFNRMVDKSVRHWIGYRN